MTKPSIEYIVARCTPVGEHLLWTGGVSGSGKCPRVNISDKERYNARRLAYEAYHGVTLAPTDRMGTCMQRMCLAKGCLHISSRAESSLKAFADPEVRKRHHEGVKRSGRMARLLSPDQAQLAATSVQSLEHVAKFLGCSRELVSAIRTGRRHQDVRR